MSSPRKSRSARKSSPTKTAVSLTHTSATASIAATRRGGAGVGRDSNSNNKNRNNNISHVPPSTTTTTTTTTKHDVKYITRRNALPYVRGAKGGEQKAAIIPPETFARLHKREEDDKSEANGAGPHHAFSRFVPSAVKSFFRGPLSRVLLLRRADEDDTLSERRFLLGRDCIRDLPFFSLTGEVLFFSTHPLFLDRVFGFSFNEIITLYNTDDCYGGGGGSSGGPTTGGVEASSKKVHATVVGARGRTLWVVLEGDVVARPLPLPLLASSLLPAPHAHTSNTNHNVTDGSGSLSTGSRHTATPSMNEQLVYYYHIERLSKKERVSLLANNYFVRDSSSANATAHPTNDTSDFMGERTNDGLWAVWDASHEGHATAWRPHSREAMRYSARTSRATTTTTTTTANASSDGSFCETENRVFVFTDKILRRLEKEVEKRYPMEGPDRLQFLQRAPDLYIDIEKDDDEDDEDGGEAPPGSSPLVTELRGSDDATHTHYSNPTLQYDNSYNKTNRLVLVPRIMPATNTVGWSAEQTVAAAGGGLPYFRASLSASIVL